MNILIGSRALNYWNPNFKIKDSTDWDIISENKINNAEFHDINFLNNSKFEKYIEKSNIIFENIPLYVMSLKGLSIIKRSHLWRNLSFQKHITHYHKYLINIKDFDNNDLELLNERIILTKKEFPQGNPSLMKNKQDFFDDYVSKIYDHDYLHELISYYDKPIYTKLLRNNELVWCEKDKWDLLSYEDKCKCVAEETFVIAIERFLVPKNWKYPYKLAYIKSLDKVCTTLCSGWFRDFAIDNYPQIFQLFNENKINLVKTTINFNNFYQ